jgi:hypothetical protein
MGSEYTFGEPDEAVGSLEELVFFGALGVLIICFM